MKTKYNILGIIFLLSSLWTYSQETQNRNYITTKTYNDGRITAKTDYIDGIGRLEESILVNFSPFHKDHVTLQEYDAQGRPSCRWLPVPSSGGGAYVPPSQIKLPQAIYNNDSYAYEENIYEASPLNRLRKQYGAGHAWRVSDKAVRLNKLTNLENYIAFEIDEDYEEELCGHKRHTLPAQAYVEQVIDEDSHSTYFYYNKYGQLFLKRQLNKRDTIQEQLDTYLVYDEAGNLRYVLPPAINVRLVVRRIAQDHPALKSYAYIYNYDSNNRCIEKRLPGTDWIYQIYDKRDRLVMVQDGNLRLKNQWLYNVYDNFDRLVEQSIIMGNLSRTEIQEKFDNQTNTFPYLGLVNDIHRPFNNDSFKVIEVLSSSVYGKGYYDHLKYKFRVHPTMCLAYNDTVPRRLMQGIPIQLIPRIFFINNDSYINSQLYIGKDNVNPHITYYCMPDLFYNTMVNLLNRPYNKNCCYRLKGYPIGIVPPDSIDYRRPGTEYQTFSIPSYLSFSPVCGVTEKDVCCSVNLHKTYEKLKVLDNNASSTYIERAFYYDYKGRLLQSVERNVYGRISRITRRYDFLGNVLEVCEFHDNGQDTLSFKRGYIYDLQNRLQKENVYLHGKFLAEVNYMYDELGRLITKKYKSGNKTQQDSMTYNLRGWLTGKISPEFTMKLRYESPAAGGSTARYNGSISEWEWQQGTSSSLMYSFAYDDLDRLLGSAQYQKNGTAWQVCPSAYQEKGITYDKNGNIQTLQRTAGGVLVDNLSYTYAGNQLSSLTENVAGLPSGDIYARRNVATGTYTYDANGNLKNDSRNSLEISYNLLNLLTEVKHKGSVVARYTYLADGTKLSVRDGSGVNGYDYLGSLTYKKSSSGLQTEAALFEDGVILAEGSGNDREKINFFFRDHLGSVRVITDGNGAVKERNDYYPFGARHMRSDYAVSANRYKYNGKEKQTTGGLDYLDYGARMYDAGIGRWFTVDPLTEKYYNLSSYNYCGNNPLNMFDPNGASFDWIQNRYGDYLWDEAAKNQETTRKGWKYVGEELPEGVDRLDVLTEENGKLYYKNTSNVFASLGNLIFGKGSFVEHKPYDPVEENFTSDLVGMGAWTVGGTAVMKGVRWGNRSLKALSHIKEVVAEGKHTTRFITTAEGATTDLQPTLNRIASGGKFPHKNDGSIFKNFVPRNQTNSLLPIKPEGYYREFVHPMPGVKGPGAMRIVTGQRGEIWFTPDHYKTFIPIR